MKASKIKIRCIFYLVPLPKANYYRWLKEERKDKEDKDFLLKKRMSEIIASSVLSKEVRKLTSPLQGFIFKGSLWY